MESVSPILQKKFFKNFGHTIHNENLSFPTEDLLDECPSVSYTALVSKEGAWFSSLSTFIKTVFMPGFLLQLVTHESALLVERLSSVRNVVTIIGIIVVSVVLTPLAGWVA
jgi:hypothetical protein